MNLYIICILDFDFWTLDLLYGLRDLDFGLRHGIVSYKILVGVHTEITVPPRRGTNPLREHFVSPRL